MVQYMNFMRRFWHRADNKGQTVVEYILVVVLIVLALVLILKNAHIEEGVGIQAQKIQNSLVTP
jgi:Flp pilus assembly pilin Flp